MKIKDITISLSGVLPNAAYSNYRPGYSMTVELENGDNEDEIFKDKRAYFRNLFELDSIAAKTELVEMQYASMRFREKDGKKYPSVTSILGWQTDWRMTSEELTQYSSRGNIIHHISYEYLKTGVWVNPENVTELKDDVATVLGGSLGLHWNQCSHEKFFEENRKDIEIEAYEQTIFNDELFYCGTYDMKGTYKGKKAIFDIKSGSVHNMAQLAAYAVAEQGIEALVICAVGKTENKSGVIKPKVSTDIKGEFISFRKAREKFRLRFGI